MACKKARSPSARRGARHRDRRQATVGAPAALSGVPGAPWSHPLLFAVFISFLLASSPASLPAPSSAAQPDARAFPLLTHDGARSVALILYLIGFLTCCARATGPRKASPPLVTVGDTAPPATSAQRADVSPRYTSRVAALYDADLFLLWGAGGALAALATAVGLARLLWQTSPGLALARCAFPAAFTLILAASSCLALRSSRHLHAACFVGPRAPQRNASPQPASAPPPPRSPPWWGAAPFDEQLPRRRGSPRRRWTDPTGALARCRQGCASSSAAAALFAALGAAELLEPDPLENGVTKGVSGRKALHLPAHFRRRRAERRRARAALHDAIAACYAPVPQRLSRKFPMPIFLVVGALAVCAALAWTYVPPPAITASPPLTTAARGDLLATVAHSAVAPNLPPLPPHSVKPATMPTYSVA